MALRELDGYDAGRRAFLALIASLPRATAGDPFGRELRARPASVREALAGWVPRAAFVLAASARGLLAGDVAELCARLFPLQSELAGLGPVRAALDELRRSVPESSFGSFEPELLGSVYEGTIGTGIAVAGEATAILRPRRRAGDATCEVALDLHELCAVRGGQRAERLAALGVELEAAALRKLARAGDAAELGTLLVESRRARARLPVAGTVTALLTVDRRRSGSHYTPRLLAERVVCATLEPLLGPDPTPDSILALRICDPAMGTGAFLLAACRFLAEKLQAAAARVGTPLPASEAHRTVAERCLYGVDRDRAAIDVAKLALWLVTGDGSLSLDRFAPVLVRGEALLGAPPIESRAARESVDWLAAFPEVMARGGFDAFVGNPPWVSYAGRAAQPLDGATRSAYARFAAFAGYRNLQGLFVERAAELLRAGGRLGFVLPSSMSELAGYAPTRRAHDALCEPDAVLADLGNDAFEGVFQPCMVLCSTRRARPLAEAPDRAWSVERPDLDPAARALLEKLSHPPLPAALFGERGLQSMGEDRRYLKKTPDALHCLPLRAGGDIEPFRLRPASFHADPSWFGRRLRATHEWRAVRLVVRQTARVPLAALSDGTAFRNSLLAGFEDERYSAEFLVAYLNSSPIRWLHYVRHRDARQGMPQLKVGHLRATPAPPSESLVRELADLGAALSGRARGIDPSEQLELDGLVAEAFALTPHERARVEEAKARWDVPGTG